MVCRENDHRFVSAEVCDTDGLGLVARVPGMICERCGESRIARVYRQPGVITQAVADRIRGGRQYGKR